MALITTIRESVATIGDILDTNKVSLGLGYIGRFDEKRLPTYPAVVVSAGPRGKEVHGTHTFAVTLRVLLWVYHAKLDESHRQRSIDDLALVEAIENLLETDMTLGGKVIFGFVEDEQPGVMQPKSAKSELVVGTKMTWVGATQKRW